MCLDQLCICLIHMENYSTERYERGRSATKKLILLNVPIASVSVIASVLENVEK